MTTQYTFIHPTKSGGTALEHYFHQHYSSHFVGHIVNGRIIGKGHSNVCKNDNNPIIVVRDVKSRFHSMYKYWKNGDVDGGRRRNQAWLDKYKDVSIFHFIDMLKTNKKVLNSGFTWSQHFANTTSWIAPDTEYRNIIVVKYEADLNCKIQALLDALGIQNKHIPVPTVNVSDATHCCEEDLNDERVDAFIRDYFSSDIELIDKIEHHPEMFKMVL